MYTTTTGRFYAAIGYVANLSPSMLRGASIWLQQLIRTIFGFFLLFDILGLTDAESNFSWMLLDASIWLHQFLKAMRDDNGDIVKNAHLLGFFRRICRCAMALFYVIDLGPLPPLSKKEVIRWIVFASGMEDIDFCIKTSPVSNESDSKYSLKSALA